MSELLKKISLWFTNIFKSDVITDEIIDNIINENKHLPPQKLTIETYKPEYENLELKHFDIDKNKKTIFVIDDYQGIINTPNLIMDANGLDENNYNFIKFSGLNSGKEFLLWLEHNKDVKIDKGIIDLLINGIDGVDLVYNIKKFNPDFEYIFFTGIDVQSSEYKYNKAKQKFERYIKDDNFVDKLVLKSESFKDIIVPKILEFLKK